MPGFAYRRLDPGQIDLLWLVDRAETIDAHYESRDGGLLLVEESVDVRGWWPDQVVSEKAHLQEVAERGGAFLAAWRGDTLCGAAVVDPQWCGVDGDLVQLSWLHVGRPFRGSGVGTELFKLAADLAASWGAAGLYVSAIPTRATVDFYRHRGAKVLAVPDPGLFALEPLDIHLEFRP